jgi:hypothetical protein
MATGSRILDFSEGHPASKTAAFSANNLASKRVERARAQITIARL